MWKFCSVINLYSSHFKNMYMDCVLESEEHLLNRLYSSWELDRLLQVGIQIRCRAATIWLNFISYIHIIFCRDMTICHDMRFISKIFVSLHENDSLHCNLVCYY